MTLKIEVTVPMEAIQGREAANYLNDAMAAIGFSRAGLLSTTAPAPTPASTPAASKASTGTRRSTSRKPSAAAAAADETATDDNATENEDNADEAAEVEENRDEKNPLTIEDVKAAVNGYVKKFGMAATQEDGPKIFVEALGEPPAGEAYWKMSLLPDDQDKLQAVIDTWKKAIELNPLKRKAV